MKILLFGGSGQLGVEIQQRAHDLNFEVVSPVATEVDIADAEQVGYHVARMKPDLIINAAAYTAVDKAEVEKDQAYRINRDGVANIARATKEIGARLFHISTDYVFDGRAQMPIPEDAPTAPLNVYGASKLAGEEIALEILGKRALIVRTSSLHGKKGINFVHTMLDLFQSRELVKVVNDQYMCATWAGWLAETLLDLGRIDCNGIVNACCSGVISWFDFASAILEFAKPKLKPGTNVRLEPVSAAEFIRPAKRPAYSALDTTKLSKLLGRKPMAWQDGLKAHLKEIGFCEQ